MKVWACFNCYWDFANSWENLYKIVATREIAEKWQDEIEHTESVWREIKEFDVEGVSS